MSSQKGTYEKCTWTKDDIESPARYFDEDGNEITINQERPGYVLFMIQKKTRS